MATVRINHAQARVVSVEAGVRLVTQVLYEIQFEAKIMATGGPYSSGNLADSIDREGPIVTGSTIRGSVGSNLPYAASVHDGAQIHPIFPKGAQGFYRFGTRARPQLRFFWRRAGRVVYMPQVPGSPSTIGRSHPGIKSGKKYLTEPLRNAARRHGMRVITF
jgi:hypothetical protein